MDTTSNELTEHERKLRVKKLTALSDKDRKTLLEKLKTTKMDLELQDGFFRGILFSGPGGGKTTFGLRIGDQSKKTVIFDGENSTEIVKRTPDQLARYKKGLIEAYPFPGIREITELLPVFEDDPNVDTVMIDTFTAGTAHETRDILQDVPFSRGSAAPGEETVLKDYGLLLDRWTHLIDVALMTRLNFILVCHERGPTEEEIKAGFTFRTVLATMKQAAMLTGRLSNVLYLTASWNEKNERVGRVYTRPITGQKLKGFPDTYAKNRLGLPREMSDTDALKAIAASRVAIGE